MNFSNQMNSTSQLKESLSPYSSAAWSPFSTPSLFSYDNSSTSFQYSTVPSIASRSIAKSTYEPISDANSNVLSDVTSKLNCISKPSNYGKNQSISANHLISNYQSIGYSQINYEIDQLLGTLNNRSSSISIRHENDNSQSWSSSTSPTSNPSSLPKRSEAIDMSEYIRQAAVQRAMGGRAKMCTFCKTNGEKSEIYMSHSLKDSNDKITCPILMRYECPVCGATGEQTHTKKYCPVLQKKLRLDMLNKMANANIRRDSSSSPTSSSSN